VVAAQADKARALPETRVKLQRQAMRGEDTGARLEADDSISIHLRTAFLKDFEAAIGHPLRGFRPNGEIAIVVKAFEFGDGKDFNFGPDAAREGRLVFYSPDVEKGQILNFANLPVYGPITYTGKPVGIDISVIEIDAEDAQIAALLGTLASYGAKAYPPAAPVLPVLNALGKALLDGGTNDTEMRFTLMLDPGAGYEGVSHPTVEAGDYVFIKEDNRLATTPWDELEVDTNTGRVYRNGAAYVDNTYLTFQINKGLSSATIDLANNTFGKFLDELDQRDLKRAEDLQGLQDEIEKLGFARTQARELDSARDLLAEWRTAQRAGDLGEAKRAAFKLFGILQEAIRVETATPGKADLSKEQITYLLDRLVKMADASSHADLQKFTLAGFPTAAANFDALFDTINHGMSA
jgi:hypothetical protein